MNQLSKLITNALHPEFTVGLMVTNPSNGCLRCSGLEWNVHQTGKSFILALSLYIIIVSFESNFLLTTSKNLLVSRPILWAAIHFSKILQNEKLYKERVFISLLWCLNVRRIELLQMLLYCIEADMILRLGCCSLSLCLWANFKWFRKHGRW